jgi:hypothetical protein
MPPTLYAACIGRVAKDGHETALSSLLSEPNSSLTEAIRCDLLLELHRQKRISSALSEYYLARAEVILPVLSVAFRRTQLHAVFQAAVDEGASTGNSGKTYLVLETQITFAIQSC